MKGFCERHPDRQCQESAPIAPREAQLGFNTLYGKCSHAVIDGWCPSRQFQPLWGTVEQKVWIDWDTVTANTNPRFVDMGLWPRVCRSYCCIEIKPMSICIAGKFIRQRNVDI